jgi:hypothetical protein
VREGIDSLIRKMQRDREDQVQVLGDMFSKHGISLGEATSFSEQEIFSL